jgi:hypothetical protein
MHNFSIRSRSRNLIKRKISKNIRILFKIFYLIGVTYFLFIFNAPLSFSLFRFFLLLNLLVIIYNFFLLLSDKLFFYKLIVKFIYTILSVFLRTYRDEFFGFRKQVDLQRRLCLRSFVRTRRRFIDSSVHISNR